ncbi:hypothetical protein FNV43_RR19414 [Rhamnella rubrinervis]|uniref:Uncharacterized protein n=1 Tax=Rhamnella rubrinervis TaxID=2594499 RepID=A0A8K0DSM1_9ROSA|nr:hypothetical protein FNV43_RR19414 [Rhamnella rubrinervis]
MSSRMPKCINLFREFAENITRRFPFKEVPNPIKEKIRARSSLYSYPFGGEAIQRREPEHPSKKQREEMEGREPKVSSLTS